MHTQRLFLANIGKPPLSLTNCTTKEATHLRTLGYQGTEVSDITLLDPKDTFLSSKQSKQRFINLLNNALFRNSFQPVRATCDVDLQIVQQTLSKARTGTAVPAGEDTDLLMLLLYQANHELGDVFFVP